MSAGDITLKWGSAAEAGVTITSLSNDALSSASSTIDLTGSNVVDVIAQLKTKTATGTLNSAPYVALYAFGSIDGTNFTNISVNSGLLVGVQRIVTANTEEWSSPFSVARAYGGVLPPYLQFAVENQTNIQLNTTADAAELYYAIVYANVAAA